MKLTRSSRILLSIVSIIAGWLINAAGWITDLDPLVSALSLLIGIGLLIGGIVFLIISLTQKKPY
jgi:uncharacterized membrane protein HdeD (DUF308 family)